MKKLLTEQKVLNELGIADFTQLTKEKVITMASMLDKMEPDVAMKALDQFPEFAATAKDMLTGYKDTLDKGLETNKDSVQSYYDSCNLIIESLQKQLDEGDLSFEEKKYVVDKMLEVSKMMGEKDSENKKFICTLVAIGAAALGFVAAGVGAVLGGSTEIGSDDND